MAEPEAPALLAILSNWSQHKVQMSSLSMRKRRANRAVVAWFGALREKPNNKLETLIRMTAISRNFHPLSTSLSLPLSLFRLLALFPFLPPSLPLLSNYSTEQDYKTFCIFEYFVYLREENVHFIHPKCCILSPECRYKILSP